MINVLFLGLSKHYPGDNCSITDPLERDQEIRKLLGVLREKYQNRKETEVFLSLLILL